MYVFNVYNVRMYESMYVFNVHKKRAFLMYVENLEMNNSLKWALFIKLSGQITSDTLWK